MLQGVSEGIFCVYILKALQGCRLVQIKRNNIIWNFKKKERKNSRLLFPFGAACATKRRLDTQIVTVNIFIFLAVDFYELVITSSLNCNDIIILINSTHYCLSEKNSTAKFFICLRSSLLCLWSPEKYKSQKVLILWLSTAAVLL